LKIEQDAQKATPGPWNLTIHTAEGPDSFDARSDDWTISNGGKSIVAWEQDGIQQAEDVVHIANCDPQTVMELVKMARRYADMQEAVQDAVQLMGPTTPTCCGCDYEWSEALAILRRAINSQRKEGGEG